MSIQNTCKEINGKEKKKIAFDVCYIIKYYFICIGLFYKILFLIR